MRIVVVGAMLLITHAMQSTLSGLIRIGNVAPNFIIMLIVSFALLRGSKEGAYIGVVAGLLYDCSFGLFVGPMTLTYGLIGWICGKLNKNFYRENFIMPFACTLISSLVYSMMNVMILWFRGEEHFTFYFRRIIVPETIYTIMLSLIIYQIIYLVNEKMEAKEKDTRQLF